MIPLYKARHEHIVNEIKFKTQNGAPVNDIEFLKNTEKDVQLKLDTEKREVKKMANDLYTTWKDITILREKEKFASTGQKLQVHIKDKGTENMEYIFNLVPSPMDEKTKEGNSLPNREASRRATLKNLKVYARLYINDMKVSETKPQHIKYPSLDVDLSEMF